MRCGETDMTKERPILFSGAMVRAILDGRKTQTRRVVKDRHIDAAPPVAFFQFLREHCPYGQPGDRLWVRETWRPRIVHSCYDMGCDCENIWVDYPAGGEGMHIDGVDLPEEWYLPQAALKGRAVPSLHMPRWASRITLEIVSTRVERLNDCSEADAIAEGVTIEDRHRAGYCTGENRPPSIRAYRELWDVINGPGAWDANPLVWVVEFKRLAPPIGN